MILRLTQVITTPEGRKTWHKIPFFQNQQQMALFFSVMSPKANIFDGGGLGQLPPLDSFLT